MIKICLWFWGRNMSSVQSTVVLTDRRRHQVRSTILAMICAALFGGAAVFSTSAEAQYYRGDYGGHRHYYGGGYRGGYSYYGGGHSHYYRGGYRRSGGGYGYRGYSRDYGYRSYYGGGYRYGYRGYGGGYRYAGGYRYR